MLQKFKDLIVQEEGQALSEYGLIIALVAAACIAILGTLGGNLSTFFGEVAKKIGGVVVP